MDDSLITFGVMGLIVVDSDNSVVDLLSYPVHSTNKVVDSGGYIPSATLVDVHLT